MEDLFGEGKYKWMVDLNKNDTDIEYEGTDLTNSTLMVFSSDLSISILCNLHKTYLKNCYYSVQKSRLNELKELCIEKLKNGSSVNDVTSYYEMSGDTILWKGTWNYLY